MTIYDVAGSTIKQIQLGYLTAGGYNQTEKAQLGWKNEN